MSENNRQPEIPITEDEAAIRKAVADYTAAWNDHDAAAMTKIFADDADIIGGTGGRMNRDAFEEVMAKEHVSIFRSSKDHILWGWRS